jgi:hypothetical protein
MFRILASSVSLRAASAATTDGRSARRKRNFVAALALCSMGLILSVTVVLSNPPPQITTKYTWYEPTPTQNNFTASNSPQYTSHAEAKGRCRMPEGILQPRDTALRIRSLSSKAQLRA